MYGYTYMRGDFEWQCIVTFNGQYMEETSGKTHGYGNWQQTAESWAFDVIMYRLGYR